MPSKRQIHDRSLAALKLIEAKEWVEMLAETCEKRPCFVQPSMIHPVLLILKEHYQSRMGALAV